MITNKVSGFFQIAVACTMFFISIELKAQNNTQTNLPVFWHKETTDEIENVHITDLFNFHPYRIYNGESAFVDLSDKNLNRISLFMVFYQHVRSEAAYIRSGNHHVKLSDNQVVSNGTLDYESRLEEPKFISYLEYSGKRKNFKPESFISLGGKADQDTPGFQGSIAEVILFDRIVDQEEKAKIESYLSLKYGISLPDTSVYVASDSRLFFNPANSGAFVKRVTGILRDDGTELYQKQSVNSHDPLRLTIGLHEIQSLNQKNEGLLSDKSGFLWSDDNGLLKFIASTNDNSFSALGRKWKIQPAFGHILRGVTTEVSIKTSNIEGFDDKYPVFMVVSPENDDFPKSEILIYPMTKNKEGQWSCFYHPDADHSGMDYFTFVQGPPMNAVLHQDSITCDETATNVKLTVRGMTENLDLLIKNGQEKIVVSSKIRTSTEQTVFLPYGRYEMQMSTNGNLMHRQTFVIDPAVCKNIGDDVNMIYPNPVRTLDPFTLTFPNDIVTKGEKMKVSVYDASGSLIRENTDQQNIFVGKLDVAGTYYVRLHGSDYDRIYKLIVF